MRIIAKILQLLVDKVPQTLFRGFASGSHRRTFDPITLIVAPFVKS
jgi:hypothetical protein